jgi:hypothetical protein
MQGEGAPAPQPQPLPGSPTRSFFEAIIRDPNAIWMRELRQSARLGRTPWILFSITLTISLLMCSIGGLAAASETAPASIGGVLFQVFFSLAYLVVVIVGPAVAANSVASEREGKTWEAVLLTGLSPKHIARGKFLAAYTTIALYIVALAPVGALSFLFGGVTATEIVVAFSFLFLLAALSVAFGLAVSSLMSSLRGAIVVTLMLAICIGPILYLFFGFGCSFAIHKMWSEVPEAFPIWLPLAYSRAQFGLNYILFLFVIPLIVITMPAWFLYEVTIANLTGDADDRSTGLKRWFTFTTPAFALACAAPSAIAEDDESRMILCITGLCIFAMHLAFSALLFAAEPAGPSRRVRIHWERERAGIVQRFFGPGLGKTSLLVALMGLAGVLSMAFGDTFVLQAFGSSTKRGVYTEQIFFFALYTAGLFIFLVGLAAWLRSRNNTPWIARLITAALLFLISAGPWVVAAIGGVLARHNGEDWLVIGAPSPFYAFYMMAWVEKSSHSYGEVPVIEAGVACTLFWGLLGVWLLAAAGRRCDRLVAEYDAAVAQAEAALRAEEEQLAAAAANANANATTPDVPQA